MTRGAAAAAVAAIATAALAAPVRAQSASVWMDASAAHSRPPASAAADAASYGLLTARLRVEGVGSDMELATATGRGAGNDAGTWLSGRALFSASHVHGLVDAGIALSGNAMTFLAPIRVDGGDEYSQSQLSGGVRPAVGVSIGATRVGAEVSLTRGVWRSSVATTVLGNPPGPLPLPGPGTPQQQTTRADGEIAVAGGALSLLRMMGAATVELRASAYDADNQAARGRYAGIDAAVALSLGAVDLSLGARRWHTPLAGSEVGGHAGIGLGIGDAAYVQAMVSRAVSDPVSGISGDVGLSAGLSVRLGRRALGGPPPAAVGGVSGAGRTVRFTLKREARSVDVAGDFSGWEKRPLARGADGVWYLETVLQPGVYHYSFVIDGDTWLVPEDASGLVDDGFGRKNATLVVAALENTR